MNATFHTYGYRGWWIHTKMQGNAVTVHVQSPEFELFPVKTVEGAKRLITRKIKGT